MSEKFDVAIIGGGPGGTPAAMRLAGAGKKVLLVEALGKLGGACLFIGCIPSKIIKHGADAYAQGKHGTLNRDEAWKSIKENMHRILNGRSGAAKTKLDQAGIRFVEGKARFISNTEIEVNGLRYDFDKAIIAPGARSVVPPFQGDGVQDVLISEILFDMQDLPKSMVIIGGGPIGIELAQMFNNLEVKITVIEMMESLVYGLVEPEFALSIAKKMTDTGIDVQTGAKVQAINRSGHGYITTYIDQSGSEKSVAADKVLVVTGKRPNIDGLNLEATGVRLERGGIVVDEHLETSVPGIYATGDVILGGPKFAHVATQESQIVATNMLQPKSLKTDFSKTPWVLFSSPEIAGVGMTEAQARKAGYTVLTGSYNYAEDATAQINEEPFGILKYIVDVKTKRILGIHLFHNVAADLVGEASIIVSNELTLMDVAKSVHPHPTLTEAFNLLAYKMLADPQLRK